MSSRSAMKENNIFLSTIHFSFAPWAAAMSACLGMGMVDSGDGGEHCWTAQKR